MPARTQAPAPHPLRVHVTSLGCPKNRVDTERFLAALGPVEAADHPAEADVVFVNTCAFIAPAVAESAEVLLDLASDLQGTGDVLLVAAGCLPGRYGEAIAAELPEVDLWLPVNRFDEWPALLAGALGRTLSPTRRARAFGDTPGNAYLKIAEGCRHGCAFCTIPSFRGRLRSDPPQMLLAEARELVAAGAHELVVVAQDVTSYGHDLPSTSPNTVAAEALPALINDLCTIDGLAWLRLMYCYPRGLTHELLAHLAALLDKGAPLLPYFDVPLQHAAPDVLARMGRPFAGDPREVLTRIRSHIPHATLRTTFITGYPGETEADFEQLCEFVTEARFDHLGVFAYQPEEGTRAAELPDQIAEEMRQQRADTIMALQAEISRDKLAELIGTRQTVLVEAPHPDWPGLFTGRIASQAPQVDGHVYLSAPPPEADGASGADASLTPGQMVQADIEDLASDYDLSALVVEGE